MIGSAKRGLIRDEGFTLVEMMIALTMIGLSFMALTYVLTAALGAYGASRSRSSVVEVANAELESLRALDYDALGVAAADPDYGTAYPGGKFEGRDAVVTTSSSAPPAVTTITTSTQGIPVPYTVRRWVTWTDPSGGATHVFKRLTVRVEWTDRGTSHTMVLTSVRYPGGLGSLASGANAAPVAALTIAPAATVSVGDTVSVDATASSDPDADPLSFEWDFGDGTAHVVGTPTASHIYAVAGAYTIQLTVSDGRGGAVTALQDVTVVDAGSNEPPSASFTLDPSSGIGPLTVHVDAGSSGDPDGTADIASYTWDWGDGSPQGTGINASHVFTVVGGEAEYVVTLTVRDLGGLTATTARTVTVTPLTCAVSEGGFRNPGANTTPDDVVVAANNKPVDTAFAFFATTNAACTSVNGRITHNTGTLTVALALVSEVNGVKTWSGTGVVGSADRFSIGINQSGEIRAPVATGGDTVRTFSFNVHTRG